MSDKYQELLDQYDIEILSSFRNKGTFQCETDKGLVLLKEYHHSLRCLANEYEWKESLAAAGYVSTDRYIVSKEDSLVVYDRYHTPFVLKHYFRGRECDCKEMQDVYAACRNLACLHETSSRINNPPSIHIKSESIKSIFTRRNRELKNIRRYISRVSRKNSFELLYIKYYESFYREACHALSALQEMDHLHTEPDSGICHGSYQHHNILILPDDSLATINFESICYQPLLMDFYLFMRKTLEKNHYDYSFFENGIKGYSEIRRITKNDLGFLYFLFLYPDKFWKISNRYFNHRKSWISPKMEQKLVKLLEQDEERKSFLAQLYSDL